MPIQCFEWTVELVCIDHPQWTVVRRIAYIDCNDMPTTYEELMNSDCDHHYANRLQKRWNRKRYGDPSLWEVKKSHSKKPHPFEQLPADGIWIEDTDRHRWVDFDGPLMGGFEEGIPLQLLAGIAVLERTDELRSTEEVVRQWAFVGDRIRMDHTERKELVWLALKANWRFLRLGPIGNYRLASYETTSTTNL